ncbi:receptor-type tyrosine-protein phosphatase U-like isoform X7 [Salvelinus fontinalis]|uniref:receptor-type tyrosine-protein phosphatase U-like isoform X7 n=1 Tax=Salvelinus fontinalis TaxID=8038 RepID=UPI002485AD64|nr:receptor-type tyrosine-protein phosphatase U-like isoform X7 [Salvelinus fontinalis]
MNNCAFLLILAVQIYAEGIEGPTAGCTFDEDSEPSLCDFTQGEEDDFDWQLFRTHNSPYASDLLCGSYMLVNSSQHAAGHRAQLLLQTLSENDTHCVQFSYFLYSRDGHSPGALRAYVRVNGGPLGSPVWNTSGSHGRQWHQVELAVSTFWPNEYQVLIEATVSRERRGYIAIDDIMLLTYPCYKAPHFSRLGDEEVNTGQNATFQCVASGRASEAEKFLLERHSGDVTSTALVKHLSHRRFVASLQVDSVQCNNQDLYRCVTQSSRSSGVSNFAELIVKEPTRALRSLTASEIQSRQLTLQWETLAYNLTRCHTYSVSLCYRYATAGGGGGHNTTVRECLAVEHNASRFTLRDLPAYHSIQVRLALANPEGKKEGREVTFQTEEDIPGGITPESLTFTPLEDMIFLKWEEPVEPNGLITQYEISYQSIESSDPGINVPGPRRTVSKLRNETYHMFSNLHPGTTYLISVRARTTKGFGQTALTEITTNISDSQYCSLSIRAPMFDYGDMLSPLSETESTITVLLRPALGRGAPVSTYQVVVEEESDRKVKRELEVQDCYPLPMSHGEAQARGTPHYYTAELLPSSLPEASPFTVGDNHTYNSYWNTPLDPRKSYLVYFQAMSNFRGESRINCIRIGRKEACKEHRRALEVSQHSEEMGLILGVCAGGLVVLILLLGAIIIIIRKGKPVNINKTPIMYRQEKSNMGSMERSFTDQSTLQEDECVALSAARMAHTCSMRGEQCSSVNESSSLLGGSPQRQCVRKGSPYHTGQLHPAVRVADLLQHINQMKTAEGYGFKQEYESFFDGWDCTKNKDKTKGRHDTFMGCKSSWTCQPSWDECTDHHNRHRVKLYPLLGDPNSDYINANYIDIRINREGYLRSNHFIATQGPKQETVYDFWRMVWQENCFSIVMITKLVEIGRVKCCKYWPDVSEMYGDIKITLLKLETLSEYTVRTFALERMGYSAKHEVCQFHFTSWPEHGVPYHATGLLAFIRRVKASTPTDAGPVVVHCSVGAGRTGCYIVLDVMLDMAECEGVVDIYNCVKTLCSRRINMIQTEEQYIFIHDAILEACLCGETAILVNEFALIYKDMLRLDSQSNSSQLRDEFQTLNSVTPHLDVEECSIALLPRNREKNRSMDVLPPDRVLAFLVTTEGESNNYINAALTDSFHQPAAFIVTPHPLPGTTADFWRLVFDYGCTSVVMLNQLNQSNSAWPCVQYWPEPGLQQYGPMEVEFLSTSADDDVITRLFCVKNVTRLQEGQLVVCQFQFLRWSAYRDVPDSKKAFLSLLARVHKWQRECGDGRTVVHCLNGGGRSGTFCASTILLEMIQYQNMVDIFYSIKTLRNSKPNMVESLVTMVDRGRTMIPSTTLLLKLPVCYSNSISMTE